MTGFNSKRDAAADKLQEPVCDKDPQGCWNVRCQLGKQCKNLAQPAQEPDWKEQYEYQKRRAEMWIAKYEKDIGPLEKVQPAQEPVQEPHEYDWSMLEAAKESLREHMARIKELEEALAQPAQEPVALESIEQYRLQMAGISTAAIGYWKEGDSIHPDYDTLALRDVAKLYAKYDELYKAQPAQEQRPWVDLSDSQIEQVYFDFVKRHRGAAMPWGQVQFGRVLQALIQERNS